MAVFRLRYGSREVVLPLGKFTIGRAADCTLRIDDEHLSRHHAILRIETDKVAIRDAGSRNGVMVNGVRIRSTRYIVPGDRVRLGTHELELLCDDVKEGFVTQPTREDPGGTPVQAPPPTPTDEELPKPDVLSQRELEVLELLTLGHTQREIAERLGVGTKSVETYRSRIGEKLGLRTRAELVRYALRHGLVKPY
ncbi:MAG: FHA domain-containing protein [Myxococcota bacterium]